MAKIDLIPGEYHRTVARLHELKVLIGMAVVVGLLGMLVGGVMHVATTRINSEYQELTRIHALSDQQTSELNQLSDQRDKLLSQRDALNQLRGGKPITEFLLTIDRAIPEGEVWFRDWRATRSSGSASVSMVGGIDTNSQAGVTQMSINGQAVDHAALSRFIRKLFYEDGVQDVNIIRTAIRRYPTHSIVDFELAVILHTGAQS